ncbi:chromatin remodeling complex Adenosinetriphosphatase [Microbotryomycetes sp. JL221]|nr:chromatin remodeling complex Adenosinetriphosphatase [Microbotryomycetes sp. JL221]
MQAPSNGRKSTTGTPNPIISLPQDDQDKFSDYIPNSNELSRVPSRQASEESDGDGAKPTVTDTNRDDDEQDEEEDQLDSDVDMEEASTSNGKPTNGKETKQQQRQRQKKEAKLAIDDKLSSRRVQQASLKSADTIKRFSYLLGQTDLFRHFCDLKAQRDPEFAAMLAESEKARGQKRGRGANKSTTSRGRKTEKEEDEELLAENKIEDGEEGPIVFTESPIYVKGGKMRDYQIQGLNWMAGLHHNGINGILADEMGLGKTLQTIAFLGYLKHHRNIRGPHLIVVPKSTLDNWAREFDKWVPGFNVVMLRGGKEERAVTVNEKILPQDFEVLITSYELCLREKSALKKLSWEYIVIDEAHRIKNVDSMLSQIVRVFDSRARLLITGTPLQNNLHELWALLNFLLPDVFSDVSDFDAWFEKQQPAVDEDGNEIEQTAEQKESASNNVVKQLHSVLRPFLLRRVKMDVEKSLLPKKEINVYVGMTELQRKWYKMILEKDIDAVNGAGGKKEGKTRLQNIVMQLRKCCNHPYLFDGAEPGPPFTTDEHLVEASGKMIILDKLLKTLKARGSRVLIFSQMSRVLDILEDYCHFREYQYCRLDGNTDHDLRMESIDAYNKPGSEKFVFLLTTRAGGLGINLVTADTVVLYDSDWNPQADLQAMDRAHRIGQTKQVNVYRFVTENAVEEKVLERAAQKLRLDQLVIQQGRMQSTNKAANKDELVDMIQHGAEKIINSEVSMDVSDDIDAIIRRGEERTAELNSKYAALSFDDLQVFKSENVKEWEGEEYGGAKKKIGLTWIEPSKRERKSNYSVDEYYRTSGVGRASNVRQRMARGTRAHAVNDWQFFTPRLIELQEKELFNSRRKQDYQVPLREDPDMTAEDLEAERAQEQELVDNAEPLTAEEEVEKTELLNESFPNWTKREYQAFIRGCENWGRDNYEDIHQRELMTKTVDEIKAYANVFWDRYKEIEDWERQIKKIEEGEAARQRNNTLTKLVRQKIASAGAHPLHDLKILYSNQTKGKSYTDEEDRFLLCKMAKYGVGADVDTFDHIKMDINESPLFMFDWFIKSRTPQEIGRRCTTLVSLVEKELDPAGHAAYEAEQKEKAANLRKSKKEAKEAAAVNGADTASVNGSTTGKRGRKRAAAGGSSAAPTAPGSVADGDVASVSSSRASTPAVSAPPAKRSRKSNA